MQIELRGDRVIIIAARVLDLLFCEIIRWVAVCKCSECARMCVPYPLASLPSAAVVVVDSAVVAEGPPSELLLISLDCVDDVRGHVH